MHLWEVCGVHGSDCLHAADVKKENFLVCSNTYCIGSILSHLDAVDISFVTLKIGKVFACLAVPHFDIFVNLTSREQD
jgi:hypothetical protein